MPDNAQPSSTWSQNGCTGSWPWPLRLRGAADRIGRCDGKAVLSPTGPIDALDVAGEFVGMEVDRAEPPAGVAVDLVGEMG